MTAGEPVSTAGLAASTRSLLEAAGLVRNNLHRAAALSIAVEQLEAAAEAHDTGITGVVTLGFAELDTNERPLQVVTQDLLLTAMADLDVADVLLSAAVATGDGVGPAGDPALLDHALVRLDDSSRSMAGEGDGSVQLGFAEPAPPAVEPPSPDLGAATDRLRGRVDELLQTLKRGTEGVARCAVTAMKDMAPEAVKSAVAKLGEEVPALPKVGRLIAQGLRKLERALQTLGRLLHLDVIGRVRDRVAHVWTRVQDGTALEPVLRRFFGDDDTRIEADRVLEDVADAVALDDASAKLSGLTAGFNSAASTLELNIGRISAVTATLVVVSHFVPVIAPWVVPTAATAYLLVLGTAVVVGMDYADAGIDRGKVEGVRQVLRSARA